MTIHNVILPFENELPLEYAERLGIAYAEQTNNEQKKIRGQFFTPSKIAVYMARMVHASNQKQLRILDPGCGIGILSISLIQTIVNEWKTIPKVLYLSLFETDKEIHPYCFSAIEYLRNWLNFREVELIFELNNSDFILYHAKIFQSLDLFNSLNCQSYDIIISNPPYFKLSKNDPRAVVVEDVVYGQPNIYALFMAVASKLLIESGQMVFIVPRGFAAGQYFRKFRKYLLKQINICKIHLFDSRTASFKKDKVLQELLIVHCNKSFNKKGIVISTSHGSDDLDDSENAMHPYKHIVDLSHPERIIFLPTNTEDIETMSIFRKWSGTLEKYGIQISTGPVVSFRSKDLLFQSWQNHSVHLVPLFQLINTAKMSFHWPVIKNDKPQYINQDGHGKKLLIPNSNYIFLRRFSAKGDASRLIASPYFALKNTEWIGVENHLNYIYKPGSKLNQAEVIGLSALLNSNLFDRYFRTFNGNINVSATELRNIPLPPLEDIETLGNYLIKKRFIENLDEINNIIDKKYTLQKQLQYE